MSKPVRVAITGAAGNIGYQLCFRIAAGDMLGSEQPVALSLIEIAPAMDALEGTVMELRDGAFPLLDDIVATTEINEGFDGADVCILVGARPRGPGMERKDGIDEEEVSSLRERGLSLREIARRLNLSKSTVARHLMVESNR